MCFGTIENGNTCPGVDGISVGLLAASWDVIGMYVTIIFRACLHLGYYPTCFKLAGIIFLLKDGRNLISVKGWRLISPLSCYGKCLERLIAKKVSHSADISDIVGEQQFGALPK